MSSMVRSIARILSGKLMPRIAYPVLRGPLRNAWFVLGALEGEGGGATVYFNMLEPEQTAAMADLLKKGQVLFDIGANVGFYTVLGSRLVGAEGKVLAFEPVARNLAYLYRHIAMNKLRNVMIVSAACSETVSLALFTAGANNAMGHLAGEGERGSVSLVPTVSVDALVQRTGIAPHVMKIDVEGAELSVLKGARTTLQKHGPAVFLSTHSDKLRTDCLAYLKGCGFRYEALGPDTKDPSSFLACKVQAG
jgi:FkbM family methyltransferase